MSDPLGIVPLWVIARKGAEVTKAGQSTRQGWVHIACGTNLTVFSSSPNAHAPIYGGWCPECKRAVDLPDD